MDFSTDGMGRQPAPGPNTNRFAPAAGPAPVVEETKPKMARHSRGDKLWARIGLIVFLLCMVALVVALLLYIANNKPANEGKYVNTSEYQAVEVADGQTPTYYYGNVTDISAGYLVLSNPLVLTSAPSNQTVTVAALNCVSPNASDQLVINLGRVIYWDNLASTSPAAQAIHEQALQTGSCPSPASPDSTSQPGTSASVVPSNQSSSGSNQSSSSATNSPTSTPSSSQTAPTSTTPTTKTKP